MVGTLHERMVSDGVVVGPEDWMDTTEPLDPVLGRCVWAGASGPRPDPLMTSYHDDEWGRPTTDDVELFERLVLERLVVGGFGGWRHRVAERHWVFVGPRVFVGP